MATRKDERIVTFDYDELATFSDTVCELVPLSQKDVSVLVSCLRVAHWVARWFAGDKLLRELGRFTDIEDALTYIENLERKLLMTGCLEGLISVMGEIRDAIRSQAQCCQSGNNGLHMVDLGEGDLVYGTQQPLTPPTTFGGEGEFEDEAAFIEHRCAAANNIVAGLILSLNSWSALSLVSLLAGGIVVGIFVANPPLGVLLALAMVGFAYGVFLTISNYIANNREAWVCAIFNADDYQTFLANIDSRIADMVITLDIGAFELEVTELIHSVLDTDTFNKMFTVIGLPEVQDAVDCSVCEEEDLYYIVAVEGQTVTRIDDNVYRVSSRYYGPWQRNVINLAVKKTEDDSDLDFYISDYSLYSGTIPEWYGEDGVNWSNYPIPSNYLFTQQLVTTMDTQGENYPFVMDFTLDVQGI